MPAQRQVHVTVASGPTPRVAEASEAVPRILAIYAISKLHCTICRFPMQSKSVYIGKTDALKV